MSPVVCEWPEGCKTVGTKLCHVHRQKGRRFVKYVWTPEREDILRAEYRDRRGSGAIAAALRRFGWPDVAYATVKRRAAVLGLSSRRETPQSPWTPDQIAFLDEHAGARPVHWIAKSLPGERHTVEAVSQKIRELGASARVSEGYTIESLRACLGESGETIKRWVRLGHFGRPRYVSGASTPAYEREPLCLTEGAVVSFLRNHPTVYRLDHVAQAWFLGLVFSRHGQRKDIAA